MQKIVLNLRFEKNIEEAVNFYVSLFKGSKITYTARYGKSGAEVSGIAEWKILTIDFELAGQEFTAINGGPYMSFTPATSFFVNCESEEEIDALRAKLSDGWVVMMPYQQYPFSQKFGRVSDKYGVSRQVSLAPAKQKITPFMMFIWDKAGKVEEAVNFYTQLFPNSKTDLIARYEEWDGDKVGLIKHAKFTLDGYQFGALESTYAHQFAMNWAISFLVNCKDQQEIDKYRNALLEGWQAQQCGRLVDKYGVTWQIIPEILGELMTKKDPAKVEKVMQAMLKMVKLDVEALRRAGE